MKCNNVLCKAKSSYAQSNFAKFRTKVTDFGVVTRQGSLLVKSSIAVWFADIVSQLEMICFVEKAQIN